MCFWFLKRSTLCKIRVSGTKQMIQLIWILIWSHVMPFNKGQLISKGLFDVFNYFKNEQNTSTWCIINKFFPSVLGRIQDIYQQVLLKLTDLYQWCFIRYIIDLKFGQKWNVCYFCGMIIIHLQIVKRWYTLHSKNTFIF